MVHNGVSVKPVNKIALVARPEAGNGGNVIISGGRGFSSKTAILRCSKNGLLVPSIGYTGDLVCEIRGVAFRRRMEYGYLGLNVSLLF